MIGEIEVADRVNVLPVTRPTSGGRSLEARGVSFALPGGRLLLDGVSVALEPGKLLAVIGPNGAGKSTLLRLFAGELAASGGEILLNSRPLGRCTMNERARRVAVLPQQSSLNAALTGLEVTLLGRSPHPAAGGGPADLAIAHEALVMMEAAHLAARRYPSLSGGEKSRVQTARVIAQIWDEPAPGAANAGRFLLLDEPTAALDCAHQHHLLERVRHLARTRGIAVLAVLHDLNLAAQYADDILALKAGRTVAQGLTRTVFREDILTRVFDLNLMVFPHPLHDWPVALTC